MSDVTPIGFISAYPKREVSTSSIVAAIAIGAAIILGIFAFADRTARPERPETDWTPIAKALPNDEERVSVLLKDGEPRGAIFYRGRGEGGADLWLELSSGDSAAFPLYDVDSWTRGKTTSELRAKARKEISK